MVDDVVTGDAVHVRADAARRALHAATRRRPPPPEPSVSATSPAPGPPTGAATAGPSADDPRLRALAAENQALRAENAALRAALADLRDTATAALED